MKYLSKLFVLIFLPILVFPDNTFPWVVYYGDEINVEAFDPYNPIILDGDSHSLLKQLLKKNKEVLGYLDLAEINEQSPWFSKIKQMGLLIQDNQQWPGDWAVDIRDPYWKDLVVNHLAPTLISQGFTGIMIDQTDVAIALEQQDPKKYGGMMQAAVDLIRALGKKFPGKRLMLNRGFEILQQVGDAIDYELAEALYSSYNFETKKYFIQPEAGYEWELDQINQARESFPHIVVFSLDYWDPEDTQMYEKIYAIERTACFRPYVSTVTLNQIIPEPAK